MFKPLHDYIVALIIFALTVQQLYLYHSSNVFAPFGLGVTTCPGRRFARQEIKAVIIYILRRYKLSFPSDKKQPIPPFDYSRLGTGLFPPTTWKLFWNQGSQLENN